MTLHELESADAVEQFKSKNSNALICFSATWCGPCRASKPQLAELARSYEEEATKQQPDDGGGGGGGENCVKVGIAYEHNLGDAVSSVYNVRAFPTYVLWGENGKKECGRVEGVRFDEIRRLVDESGVGKKKDLGPGQSLGGGAVTAEEARKRMLARFQNSPSGGGGGEKEEEAAKPAAVEESKDEEMKDVDKPSSEATTTTTDMDTTETTTMVDPTETLSQTDVETLTTVMGFSQIRAQKGLLNSTTGVEGAVEWLLDHQDDADIDDPIPLVPKGPTCPQVPTDTNSNTNAVAQSYKCNQCQKIFSNMANLELHANKTGHTDFEESTEHVKPLTAEEKQAKLQEIKNLLAKKRNEREEEEKQSNIDREKQRRFMGKEMSKTREEMEIERRKHEVYKRKKEKEAYRLERIRIKQELEKDKLERMANKGKMKSRLGVEGYNPDAIQYDLNSGDNDQGSVQKKKKKKGATYGSDAKLDECIAKVSSYRAGGDGGKCLKVLIAYVSNLLKNPDDPKFKSVNMENKAYKNRVKPFMGAKSFLMSIGFSVNDAGNALVYCKGGKEEEIGGQEENDGVDEEVLTRAKEKLEAAYAAY